MAMIARVVVLGTILLGSAATQAAIWTFEGGMNVEQSMATHVVTIPDPYFGGGIVFASLDTASGLFSWEYSFAGLTAPPVAAHFHDAPPGDSGLVKVGTPIDPVTAGTMAGDTVLAGSALSEAIAALTMTSGTLNSVGDVTDWYLNIHTGAGFGFAGELRGQLFVQSVVPIPAAVWMMISALGALFGIRRVN